MRKNRGTEKRREKSGRPPCARTLSDGSNKSLSTVREICYPMHAGTRHREPTLGRNVIGKVYNCATGLVIANEPVNRYKREFAGVSERKKAKSWRDRKEKNERSERGETIRRSNGSTSRGAGEEERGLTAESSQRPVNTTDPWFGRWVHRKQMEHAGGRKDGGGREGWLPDLI